MEWTNQHGCGGNEDSNPQKQNCVLVLQYACQDDVSDARGKDESCPMVASPPPPPPRPPLPLMGSAGSVVTPLTFAWHCLSPLAAFTSGAYFLHNGRQ